MAHAVDTKPKSSPRRSMPRLWLGVGLLCFVVARPVMKLVMGHGTSQNIQTISREEISGSLATALMQWEVFGKHEANSQYMRSWHSLVDGIRGINGISEIDGMDWYEVELTPELANQLRAGLRKTPGVQKNEGWQGRSEPGWWPKDAPRDTPCYQRGEEYLILPASGTHAWFVRVRT